MGEIDEWLRRIMSAYSDERMRQLGVVAVQYAQYLAPERTGKLRQGISYEYDAGNKRLSLVTTAPYSLFVEFGTSKMRARPYVRPALERVAEILRRTIGGDVSENLAMDFRNTTRIKHPEILAHPRNARHAVIMRQNRATSMGYNTRAGGNARQFISHRGA